MINPTTASKFYANVKNATSQELRSQKSAEAELDNTSSDHAPKKNSSRENNKKNRSVSFDEVLENKINSRH